MLRAERNRSSTNIVGTPENVVELFTDDAEGQLAPDEVHVVLADLEGEMAAFEVVFILPERKDPTFHQMQAATHLNLRGVREVVEVAPEALDGIEVAQGEQGVLILLGGQVGSGVFVEPETPRVLERDGGRGRGDRGWKRFKFSLIERGCCCCCGVIGHRIRVVQSFGPRDVGFDRWIVGVVVFCRGGVLHVG